MVPHRIRATKREARRQASDLSMQKSLPAEKPANRSEERGNQRYLAESSPRGGVESTSPRRMRSLVGQCLANRLQDEKEVALATDRSERGDGL